jgi:hypothetical protein
MTQAKEVLSAVGQQIGYTGRRADADATDANVEPEEQIVEPDHIEVHDR